MAGLQIVRQPARGFGNDFEAACDGIEGAQIIAKRFETHTGNKAGRKLDVMRDVTQAASGGSERKNCVGRDGGFDIRLEPVAAHDVDGTIEQRRDVILERDILVDADPAAGSISTMMSMSLSGRLSPRAREPNRAAWLTPRARKAASFCRSLSMIS